jgi:hypothetical protein
MSAFVAATNFLDLMPNFVDASHKLHDLLLPVCLLLAVAGVIIKAIHMMYGGTSNGLGLLLVRLSLVAVLASMLATFGNTINDMVRSLVDQIGWSASGLNPGNAFEAYRAAIARKWGSNSVASLPSTTSPGQPSTVVDPITGGGADRVRITRYGYANDSTPDWNSSHGIGNHNNQLVPGQSIALSPDVAQQYGFQPGQTVTVRLSNGQEFTGTYDDSTATSIKDANGNDIPITGRVDIYDPNNQFTSLDGLTVNNINGTGTGQTLAGLSGIGQRIGDALVASIIGPLVYILSVIAAGLMWFVSGVQQILFLVEIAISPVFIGMLMVPALVPIASRFLLGLVAVCLWPLGWAITDLFVKALIDIAINPTNNGYQNVLNALGMEWGVWIILAVVVIVASVAAPWIVTRSLVSGHSGLTTLLGTAFGVAAGGSVSQTAYRSAVLGAGAMRSALASGNAARSSLPDAAIGAASRPNFATRPKELESA